MAKKKYYDEYGNEVKKKHPILKWVGIALLAFFGLAVIGAMVDDDSSDADTQTHVEVPANNAATPATAEVEETNTVETNTTTTDEDSNLNQEQKNAVASAKNYLNFTAFSKAGLINQLSSEYGDGFNAEDAQFAVEYLEEHDMVDWNEQALKSAKNYYETMNLSKDGVYEQLVSDFGEQFTPDQAQYAIDHLNN